MFQLIEKYFIILIIRIEFRKRDSIIEVGNACVTINLNV